MSSSPKKRKLDEQDETYLLHPVLSQELIDPPPLIEAYVDTISDPKTISSVVVDLNAVFPLTDLPHLKRVKGRDVLLFARQQDVPPSEVHEILRRKNFDVSRLRNNVKIVSVAGAPPKTKKQHGFAQKFWPCNFHSDKYVEKLCTNTLFGADEVEEHVNYMRLTIFVAKLLKNPMGVVVVDPKIKSVVAVGYHKKVDNPCHHAVMVAIDNVALTQNGGAWQKSERCGEGEIFNLNGIPSSILTCCRENFPSCKFGAAKFKEKGDIQCPSDGPYLCTDYVVYSTHEPCMMCSMALIHSRVKRVFYGEKSDVGGLGTLCKIHTIKNLNHHYEVFAGLLEKECSELDDV